MFDHYPHVAVQHRVALESAIRNHSVVTSVNAPLLAKMYKLALDGLTGTAKEDGFLISKITDGKVVLSSVTDAKTGLYLQLATVQGQTGNYLTFGQKWAVEQFVPAHGNVSTTLW